MNEDLYGYYSAMFGIIVASVCLTVSYITGMVVTVLSGNWLLLIAQVILPPLATIHGIGHIFGFWL